MGTAASVSTLSLQAQAIQFQLIQSSTERFGRYHEKRVLGCQSWSRAAGIERRAKADKQKELNSPSGPEEEERLTTALNEKLLQPSDRYPLAMVMRDAEVALVSVG